MSRFALLLALLACVGMLSPARAELPEFRLGRDAALWQARSCVGEVGWTDFDACTAMIFVHAKRASDSGVTLVTMVRAYSAAVKPHPRHRPWVLELEPTGPAPRSWRRASWPRARAAFGRMLEHVERVLRGEVPDPCPHSRHYGGPMDGVPRGHVRSSCLPESRQRFYRPDIADAT